MHICHDERRNPIDFGSRGSKVKVNFGILYIKPCGHDSDYSFAQSLSNFTCTFTMMRGGTLLIMGHGVKCQGQLWPTCEGMPRLALSSSFLLFACLLILTFFQFDDNVVLRVFFSCNLSCKPFYRKVGPFYLH